MVSEAKYKSVDGDELKTLTPKQMLQRLPIALTQLNKIRQIIYSLYREKKFIKKVYNNIMNSIKLEYRMDTIFMKHLIFIDYYLIFQKK